MEVIKGIVQQIAVKDPRDGQYGKWANYGIKVNDAWYNGALNADKKTGALTLKDKDYNEVRNGMSVEFLLEEKNGYKNINGKSMSILPDGGTQQAPPIQENEKPAPMQTPPPHTVVPDEIRAELLKMYYNGLAAMQALSKFNAKDFPKDTLSHIERVAAHIRKTMEK